MCSEVYCILFILNYTSIISLVGFRLVICSINNIIYSSLYGIIFSVNSLTHYKHRLIIHKNMNWRLKKKKVIFVLFLAKIHLCHTDVINL